METIEVTTKRYICRHIHTTGNRCGSPALNGEEFCYFHHATRRGPRPADHDYLCPNSTFDLPSLEDRPSIQLAIAVVARRIALNQIDLKRGRLLLYAFRIAATNLPREPRTTEPEEIEQVEAIQHDPIHGPLAPVAELIPKEERKSIVQIMLEEMRANQQAKDLADTEPTEEPEAEDREEQAPPVEAILPQLQAFAEPHSQLTTAVRSRLNPPVPETLHNYIQGIRTYHQPRTTYHSRVRRPGSKSAALLTSR
jgi:hypothetical protein